MGETNEYPEGFRENTNYEIFVRNRIPSLKNLNSYIIHYKPFKSRRENIRKQYKENNFKPIFVESFDREDLTEKETSLFNTDLLNPREISIFMKHMTALRHAYKNNQKEKEKEKKKEKQNIFLTKKEKKQKYLIILGEII